MGKGSGGGKAKDPSMPEDDYFIIKNPMQKTKLLPPRTKKKPALNYSGKIEITYKKSK